MICDFPCEEGRPSSVKFDPDAASGLNLVMRLRILRKIESQPGDDWLSPVMQELPRLHPKLRALSPKP